MINLKITAWLLLAACAFSAGWVGRTWLEDSKDLAKLEKDNQLVEDFRVIQSDIAMNVERQLKGVLYNDKQLTVKIDNLRNRPIYINDCIDDDGLRLIEDAAVSGSAIANK